MAEAIAVRGLPRPRRDGYDRRRFGKDGVVGHRHLHVHSFDRRRTIAQYPNERKRLIRRCTPLARGSAGNCGGNTQTCFNEIVRALVRERARLPTYLPQKAARNAWSVAPRPASEWAWPLAGSPSELPPTTDRGALDPAVAAELLRLSRVEAVAAVLRRGRTGGCGRGTDGTGCERR